MLALGVVLAGCATYTTPVAPPRQLTKAEKNFEALFMASQYVLRRHGFEIDRRDRRRGEITTKPMVSRNLGEFWRDDAAHSYDLVEGALHKIFIVATVRIERLTSESDDFFPTVIVQRLRSSDEEKEMNAARVVKSTIPGRPDRYETPYPGPTVSTSGRPDFVNLGRDANLEDRLANEIVSAEDGFYFELDEAP